ncbi:MAG: ATP-dependent Clp protease ATP-binding subunit ClpX, partial [uncultured Thermomicrobiales bacterium]
DQHARWAGALPVFVLQQGPGGGSAPDRRPEPGLHLRRVRPALPGNHRRRRPAKPAQRTRLDPHPHPAQTLRTAQPVRRRSGPGEKDPFRRRLQPLQADQRRPRKRGRRRAAEEQHSARRPDRLRQDPPGPNPRQAARRAVLDRRRHRLDRGRLRRRGRREHPAPLDPKRRRRPARPNRHHLHRRDRQDRPQIGQPQHHPRRQRRRRPAGVAEDHRGHRRQRAAAERAQAPPPGIHPDRHPQHPLYLRRRLRGPGGDRRQADRQAGADGFRRLDDRGRARRRGQPAPIPQPRRPAEVRPDPGVRRSPPGLGFPGPPDPAGTDADPDRAAQRRGQAIPEILRPRRRRTRFYRRRPRSDRQAGRGAQNRRPWPADHDRGGPPRRDVRDPLARERPQVRRRRQRDQQPLPPPPRQRQRDADRLRRDGV